MFVSGRSSGCMPTSPTIWSARLWAIVRSASRNFFATPSGYRHIGIPSYDRHMTGVARSGAGRFTTPSWHGTCPSPSCQPSARQSVARCRGMPRSSLRLTSSAESSSLDGDPHISVDQQSSSSHRSPEVWRGRELHPWARRARNCQSVARLPGRHVANSPSSCFSVSDLRLHVPGTPGKVAPVGDDNLVVVEPGERGELRTDGVTNH